MQYGGPGSNDEQVKARFRVNRACHAGLLAGFRVTAPVSLTHVVLVLVPPAVMFLCVGCVGRAVGMLL